MTDRAPARGIALAGCLLAQVLTAGGLVACAGGVTPAAPSPSAQQAPQQAQGIPVSVVRVTRDTIANVSNYGGSIAPRAQVTIQPRVAGRVVRTVADTGATVTAGQLLAELDHATLDAQIAQANANIAGAVANLAAARARYEGIMAGPKADDVAAAEAAVEVTRVRLEQALAGVRPEDLRAAEVAVQVAAIRLELGRAGGRAEDLQAAQAQLDSARHRLAQVEAGTRAEDVKSLESDLQTARIRLAQLQNPRPEDVQTAQLSLDQARTRLAQARDGGIGSGISARPRPEDLATLELKVQLAQAALDKAIADQGRPPTGSTTQQLQLAVTTAQINLLTAQNDLLKARSTGGPTEWDLRLLEEAEQVARTAVERVSKPAPNDVAAAQVAVEKAQVALDKARTVNAFDVEVARQTVIQAEAGLQKVRTPDPSAIAQLDQAFETAVTSIEKLRNPLPYDGDIARANLAQAEAQLSSRRNPYTTHDRQAAEAAVRQAEAALAQQQAALALQSVNLAETQIVAPFDGIIAERLATEGAVVQVSSPVFTLMSSDTEIALNVEEAVISRFRQGSNATFSVNAYPGEVFRGSVASVFPTGDARSRTFTVKVRPDDPQAKLKPGMYAQLTVTLEERRDVPVVPRDAVILRNDRSFVFAIVDSVAQLRPIELGLSDDRKAEVKTGVQADEMVVVSGQASLRDKDAVRVIQPGQAGQGGQGATGQAGQGAAGQAPGGQGAAGQAPGGQGAAGQAPGGQAQRPGGAGGPGGQGAQAGQGGAGQAPGGQGAAGQAPGGQAQRPAGAGGQGAPGGAGGQGAPGGAAGQGAAPGQGASGGQGQRPAGGAAPTPTRASG